MKGLSAQNAVALVLHYDSREEMIAATGVDPETIDDDESTWPDYKIVGTITIRRLAGGAFSVIERDKRNECLTFDEMLGLIAALTMPKDPPCLQWMQTQEQIDARKKWRAERQKQNQTSNTPPTP